MSKSTHQLRVLMISLSATENDARVVRSYCTLRDAGHDVAFVSVGLNGNPSIDKEFVVKHSPRRIFGIPGLSALMLVLRIVQRARAESWGSPDVIHCHDLSALFPGQLLRLTTRGKPKLIYDAHEFASDQIPGAPAWRQQVIGLYERLMASRIDAMITVSDSIAKAYSRMLSRQPPTVVRNCPARTELVESDVFRQRFAIASHEPVLLYQGALRPGRGIEFVLRAFKDWSPPAHLVFMGNGPLSDSIISIAESASHIHHMPAVPVDVLHAHTSAADFGLVLGENTCRNVQWSLPNKFFEYMMAGVPVLVSNLDEIAHIVRERRVGFVLDDNSPDTIRATIESALSADREALAGSVQKTREEFCWDRESQRLLNSYSSLLNPT